MGFEFYQKLNKYIQSLEFCYFFANMIIGIKRRVDPDAVWHSQKVNKLSFIRFNRVTKIIEILGKKLAYIIAPKVSIPLI